MKSHGQPLSRPVPGESLLFEALALPQTALCWSCQVTCQQVWIPNRWKSGCYVPTKKYSCGYKFCNPRNTNMEYLDLLWWLEIQDFFYCCPVLTAGSRWHGKVSEQVATCASIYGVQHFGPLDHRIKVENNLDLWVMQACQNCCAWIVNTTF